MELVKIINSPEEFRKAVLIDTKASKFVKWLVGEMPEGIERFERPYAVHMRNDRLYIVDQGYSAVIMLDLKKGKVGYLQETVEKDILFYPTAVVADDDDNVYVCDPEKNRIVIYGSNGYSVKNIGAEFGNWRPSGIAWHGGRNRFYVVDSMNHNLNIFDREFKLLKSVGKQGDGRGEFNFPSHVSVDDRGDVYVTDSMNFRIQIFSADGRYIGKIGDMGKGDGHLERPKGVGVDTQGHVYIVDSLKDGIQVFDRDDRFLMSVGRQGGLPGQFDLPSGIFCDEKNYIYVADTLNRRVQVLRYIGGAR